MSESSNPGRPVVEVRDLSKSFGLLRVLRGVNLSVSSGRTLCVLGPSGSGKSTLLRCINFLERPDDGAVFLQFNLWPHLTVLGNLVESPIHVQHRSREEVMREAEALLEKIGLSDKRDAYPSRLSGGQKQRVAIARALAMKPEVLLFDEPTSSLDPELVGEVLSVMRNLAREGQTMIVVTHEMGFAREAADEVMFIDEGAVVETAAPDRFFGNPATPRVRQFLQRFA